ncbi:DUF6538 domain-containing protein [Paracoccus sp. S-4012]|uniref:DUF6538 domain-containing protein n=1 Tax=Paracoccus sp. S-4012 TaxID=2665648 RepID=UPI001E4F1411|nr:DUF6538 domain-containing protein [Paracoccus sp. S-4012]
MAGQIRSLKVKGSRFYARMAVPKSLQGQVGKSELVMALGADRRAAVRQLPGAVAELQRQIIDAERKLARSHPLDAVPVPGRYPMTVAQIAASHYAQRLALDEHFRDNPAYAVAGINDTYVAELRAAVAGRASNEELAGLIGREVEWFRAAGNHDAQPGTAAWREIARALCIAELEFMGRMVERNEGTLPVSLRTR